MMKIELNLESYAVLLYCTDIVPTKDQPLSSDEWNVVEKLVIESPKKDVSALFGMSYEGLTQIVGIEGYLARKMIARNALMPHLMYSLHNLEANGIKVTTQYEKNYPTFFNKLGDRKPSILFYQGDLSFLEGDCLSIVGPQDLKDSYKKGLSLLIEKGLKAKRIFVTSNMKGTDAYVEDKVLKGNGNVVEFVADHMFDRLSECKKYIEEGRMTIVCACDPFGYFDVTNTLDRNIYVCGLSREQIVLATSINTGPIWFTAVLNLHYHWTHLLVSQQGEMESGNMRLIEMGAVPIYLSDLESDLTIHQIYEKNSPKEATEQVVKQMSIFDYLGDEEEEKDV